MPPRLAVLLGEEDWLSPPVFAGPVPLEPQAAPSKIIPALMAVALGPSRPARVDDASSTTESQARLSAFILDFLHFPARVFRTRQPAIGRAVHVELQFVS